MKNKHHKSKKVADENFRTGYDAINMDGKGVTVRQMGQYLRIADRTVRERIKKLNGEFTLESGKILKTNGKNAGSDYEK